MPTFMQYVAFLSSDINFFLTDKTFRKYTNLLSDPNSAANVALTVAMRLLFVLARLNHSWGFWFGFYNAT